MKLSDAKLRTLKTPGKHFDGGGLYLELTPAGGRYWRLKYRHGGKEKRLAFGVYPTVPLKEARDRRDEARKLLALGDDPGALKKADKAQALIDGANTFEAVAREWHTHQCDAWGAGHALRVLKSLEADAFPEIGARPIAHIKPREVVALAKKIEARGAGEVADRVLKRIRAVFRYAVAHERIAVNPMGEIKPGEVLKPRAVTHRLALADADLPAFLAKLAAYDGDPCTTAALRLLMLTAVRPGELRGARWVEIDTEQALWRIPAERMKMKAPHIVPLSHQALAVLEGMRPLSGAGDLVFPSPYATGKPLSENTFNSALARMGFKGYATAHGFRALFSTVANEAGHDPDVIERQLAHLERNKVRAAYHRAEYLAERATLLQWWADHLDGRRGGKVVKLPRRAGRVE
jgi:integrase